MDRMSSSPRLALAIALIGCEAPSIRSPDVPGETPAVLSAKGSAGHAPEGPGELAWGNAIAWRDWDAALHTAKEESKSVCVVVYANWCPRCKELAPVFSNPEVASAAAGMVMVRQ